MRLLLLPILLIISLSVSSQEVDKQKHLFAGAIISYGVAPIIWKITGKKTISSIVGFSVGTMAGFAKEYYDRNNGGVSSKKDVAFTMLGAAIGSISFRIIINKSTRKKDIPIEINEFPLLAKK
jgi:hypothetical protein